MHVCLYVCVSCTVHLNTALWVGEAYKEDLLSGKHPSSYNLILNVGKLHRERKGMVTD